MLNFTPRTILVSVVLVATLTASIVGALPDECPDPCPDPCPELAEEPGEEPGEEPEVVRQLVRASGSIHIVEDDWGSPDGGWFFFENEVTLNRGESFSLIDEEACDDRSTAEVRIELRVTVTVSQTGGVFVVCLAKLFEGYDCEADELWDEETPSFNVPRNEAVSRTIYLRSTEPGCTDKADIQITVENWNG